MKKILVVFALFSALIFSVGCGNGSKNDNQNENTDTDDTATDDDSDSGDSEPVDTDTSDSGQEDPDTTPEQPDNGDTTPDDSDTTPDEGDSAPDSDDTTQDGGDTMPDNGDTTPDEGDSTPDNGDSEPDEGDSAPDNGDSEPDEDADSTPGLPDQDSAPVIEMEEGIYLGIIGFNDDLTKKPIKRLTDANKSEFKSFINSLTQLNLTALYWADYSALEMMESFTISPDLQLKKVALVTFTDGLDNQSLSSDDFNPGPYDTHADYLDAIHSMIMDEGGIHGVPVTAYSIGLKGSDVTDEAKFENTLEKLATEETGDEKFVFQVTDMNEVGQHFADIAGSLYSVSTMINVGVYIPGGYDNGQVIRYTFDNVSAATSSNLYIEATYHRSGTSRTLENIQYEGFIPGASTISSSATGPHNELYFQFNDLKYSNGDPVSQSEIISKSRLWKQTSSGAWDGETEMNMAELPPIIDEDKSSALIMLVLDSTTSLGSDFSRMQNEAKNFIEILVNGGSGVTSEHNAEECESLGGTYNNGICFKDLNCGELPPNTEWNNGATARQNYDFEAGAWELVPPAEYDDSENPGICTYKCEEGTRREDNECKNLCAAKFNGTDSYIFLDNDPRSIFDTDMGNAWTIEFWYKQETAPDKSNFYAAPILRRGGSDVTNPTFGCYPIQKYTQQTGPTQNVYGYLKNSFQTTYSYKENQWSQQTQTKEQSYNFEQQQMEDLHENEWVHVAITGESTQSQQNWQNKAKLVLKLYVAGKYLGEEDGSGDIDATSTITLKSEDDGLYLGGNLKYAQNQQYSQYSFFFKGLVGGLRISNAVVYDGDFTPAYNIDAADSTLESWMFDHGKIIKAKTGEIVSEENFNNIEWSTDCPGN